MKKDTVRLDVNVAPAVKVALGKIAKKNFQSRKRYIEKLLTEHVNNEGK